MKHNTWMLSRSRFLSSGAASTPYTHTHTHILTPLFSGRCAHAVELFPSVWWQGFEEVNLPFHFPLFSASPHPYHCVACVVSCCELLWAAVPMPAPLCVCVCVRVCHNSRVCSYVCVLLCVCAPPLCSFGLSAEPDVTQIQLGSQDT